MNKFTTLILLIALCLATANGLACSARYQCPSGNGVQSISENWWFVDCIDGQCACLTELGFIGEATTASKCRCDENTIWSVDPPVCLNPEESAKLNYDISQLERLGSTGVLRWDAGQSYTIYGGDYNLRIPMTAPMAIAGYDTELAIDKENKRIYLNHWNNEHRIFENISYFLVRNQDPQTGQVSEVCYVSNFTYADQVEGHAGEQLMTENINSFGRAVSTYGGKVRDHHVACIGDKHLTSITQQDKSTKLITNWMLDLVMSNGMRVVQNFVFDPATAVIAPPCDSLWSLPQLCINNPVDICLF